MNWTELFTALVEGFRSHRALAGKIAAVSLIVWVFHAVVLFLAVARMSPDHFVSPESSTDTWLGRHPIARRVGRLLKNAAGALLLLIGVAMLALPGPGLFTLLVALSLLDFPGKRKLVLRIVRERHVRAWFDWIRRKARRPPLELPDDPD